MTEIEAYGDDLHKILEVYNCSAIAQQQLSRILKRPLAYSLTVLTTTSPLFHADVFSAASRDIFLSQLNADFLWQLAPT